MGVTGRSPAIPSGPPQRLAIFGGDGALSRALRDRGIAEGATVVGFDELDGDKEKWPTIREILEELRPEWVINATAVAHRETIGEDPVRVREVHAVDAERLAREAGRLGLRLVHLSSDLVFEAKPSEAHHEASLPAPSGVLSRALVEGEKQVRTACPEALVVRTGCVYDARDCGFATSLIYRLAEGKGVQVSWEQMGAPTPVTEVLATMWDLARARCSGLYHVAAPGGVSWAEVAHFVVSVLGASASLVSTGPRGDVSAWLPPLRPAILESRRLVSEGRVRPRAWKEALEEFLHAEVVSRWAGEGRRREGSGL